MIKSAYVHIPFCLEICSYCAFPKQFYNSVSVDHYLEALETEIVHFYQGEALETLYVGGGTPSCLSYTQLQKLFDILQMLRRSKTCEFTFEANLDSLTEEKLRLLRSQGVTRLSIGVETLQPQYFTFLKRKCDFKTLESIVQLARLLGFDAINLDLMYAFPGETLADLKKDLEALLRLSVEHISTYSLMIEEHTVLYQQACTPVLDSLDQSMYQLICQTLKEAGYIHYEVSNFGKSGFYSRHNLTYWNNLPYYGFGLGASGYTNQVRYCNTRSMASYRKGYYRLEEEKIGLKEAMCYEMILGLRKAEGVNKKAFLEKYGQSIATVFDYQRELAFGLLVEDETFLRIPEEKFYLSNEALLPFVEGE